MKKIVFIIVALFIAIVTMAYLYFSGLSSDDKINQHSLYAAAAESSIIFSFENEQSIVDILKTQELLKEIAGTKKVQELQEISSSLLSIPGITKFFEKQNVYISLVPGLDKSIDFLYSTQINHDYTQEELLQAIRSRSVDVKAENGIMKLSFNDSTGFFVGIKDNLLLLSTNSNLVKKGLVVKRDQSGRFANFIQSNSRVAKNSLAEVYINFEMLPTLLKTIMPGQLSGELAPLDHQNAYAALMYNFSREKILFTGSTEPQNSTHYFSIFSTEQAQKISITNILPDNTASYTAYGITSYSSFRPLLQQWFKTNGMEKKVGKSINDINTEYRIDLEKVLPMYFTNQFITFQLSNAERLGAIGLTNGDKLDQLLLELRTDYTEDIKQLKVNGILTAFFGQAFNYFQKPYYTIVDNYLVFANRPESLRSFLNNYRNNKLLINAVNYGNAMDELPATSNIQVYVDLENSQRIAQKNLYLPFFRHVFNEDGLKSYASISYQLSSNNKKFLTNMLLIKKQAKLDSDSLSRSL